MTTETKEPASRREKDGPESVRSLLRRKTSHLHNEVDAAFARFNLGTRPGYSGFLLAHAHATPSLEATLMKASSPWPFRARTPALQADLASLNLPWPSVAADIEKECSIGALWGLLYVLEGSRLGGGVIASGIGSDFPRRYLESRHLKGEWVKFQTALESAAEGAEPTFVADAVAGAERAFALYARAARGASSTPSVQ
jgi:heme oxygenase